MKFPALKATKLSRFNFDGDDTTTRQCRLQFVAERKRLKNYFAGSKVKIVKQN